MPGFFWSCSFLSQWYWLLPFLLPCIQALLRRGDDFCLASVAGQAGNLDTESTGRGLNKQNGPIIMAGMLPKDRNLPVPCGPTKIMYFCTCITQTAVTAWLYTARQAFRRPLQRVKYSQLGIDSMEFFLNAKSRFQDWNIM